MDIYGILAHPANYSMSPIVHNAGFQALNLTARYERFDIPPDKIDLFFEKVKEKRVGLSVSMPYKEEVAKYCGEVSIAAKKIRAVNSLYWRNGKLIGHNTDVIGIKKPLLEKIDLEGKHVVVLGAGGAARAAVYAAEISGSKVTVLNRNIEKAKELAKEFGCFYGSLEDYDKETADVVIQATSVGMMNDESLFTEKNFHPGQIVFDIIYRPLKTKFLEYAEKAGADIITGDKMFLVQAFEQFKIFTGKDAPQEVMKKAFYAALEKDEEMYE